MDRVIKLLCPEENPNPRTIFASSDKKITWQCDNDACEGRWQARPKDVIEKKNGCPHCTSGSDYLCGNAACGGCSARCLASDERATRLFCPNNTISLSKVLRNSHKKYSWQCDNDACQAQWEGSPNNVIGNKTGCPHCTPGSNYLCGNSACGGCSARCLASDERATRLFCPDNTVSLLMVLLNSMKKYWWRCGNSACQARWEAPPYSVIGKKRGCPHCTPGSVYLCGNDACGGCSARSLASDDRARRLFCPNNTISPSKVLLNSHKKYWWQCDNDACKGRWEASPHKVFGLQTDCPICVTSQPMQIVSAELKERGIEVKYEWKQEWCKDKLELRFDYYFPNLVLSATRTLEDFVLELDGLQHFFLFPGHDFEKQLRHDLYKMKCLMEHDIPMIRLLSHTIKNNRSTWFARFEAACDVLIKTRKRKAILLEDNKYYRDWHDRYFDDSLRPYVLWF